MFDTDKWIIDTRLRITLKHRCQVGEIVAIGKRGGNVAAARAELAAELRKSDIAWCIIAEACGYANYRSAIRAARKDAKERFAHI